MVSVTSFVNAPLAVHGLRTGEDSADARKNLLLSKIGPEAFKVVVDYFCPDPVGTKSYQQLKETLEKHYLKGVCFFAERVKFASRVRGNDEKIAQFLNSLKAIAGHCRFGDSLSERLRDQLIIGINNDAWQQELFRRHTTNEATLQQVEETALVLEQASIQQQQLQGMAKGDGITKSEVCRVKKVEEGNRTQKKLQRGMDCFRCGHPRHGRGQSCPAVGTRCRACNGPDHFARVCVKSGRASVVGDRIRDKKQVNKLSEVEPGIDDTSDESQGNGSDLNVIHIQAIKGRTAKLSVTLNGVTLVMLYDPGAARSVITKKVWSQIGCPKLKSAGTLVAYSGVAVDTMGETKVEVEAFGKRKRLSVMVAETDDTSLFGLDWCLSFDIKMPPRVSIHHVRNDHMTQGGSLGKEIEGLLTQFKDLFSDELGVIVGHKAVVHLKEGAVPRVCSARPVPFPIKGAVEAELDRLVKRNILEPVDTTVTPIEWASPIVVAMKSTGAIRICVDFKTTINQQVFMDPHPLPRFEDIMVKLSGSTVFSIIDLTDAYLQLEVEEKSRKYMVVATHKGYYRYKRLPFGICFAPSIFQKTMDTILAGIGETAVYIDDIIVGGKTKEEHVKLLHEVFGRLRQANIRVKKEKCRFLRPQVTYLGHCIDKEGIHPTEERIAAIRDMPRPTNVKELRSFLGLMNYYSKFIANLHPMCSGLYELTRQGTKWRWSEAEESLFQKLKTLISTNDTLVHYDESLPIILQTDASDSGVGAVLMHQVKEGTLRPIAFASRILDDREKRYSAIDKEALAIIFGVTKFHQYIFGLQFILCSDHKPLERILSPKNEIPKLAVGRLQRWALLLSTYNYVLRHIQGKDNVIADALSRLPVKTLSFSTMERIGQNHSLLKVQIGDLPVTKKELQNETKCEHLLQKVKRYMESGWPSDKTHISKEHLTFYEKREFLSCEEDILLWNSRIVVPKSLQARILHMLHEGHPGIGSMRALARIYVWWPNIDEDIERYVKRCHSCQENRQNELETLLYSWNAPTEPWARIHIDYAGPFEGKYWLVVIDAYSKWLEIVAHQSITTLSTIKSLREIFSRFGVPKIIVSDNGTQFASKEFEAFCYSNNIIHAKSTPYHPKTNGLAERAVRTFKERMKASKGSAADWELRLQRFLIAYRNTPQKSTGRAPAELLIGRKIRTKLDLLKPDVSKNIDKALIEQKLHHDKHAKPKIFTTGQHVWVQNITGKGYQAGKVVKCNSEHSYLVEINGRVVKKHSDQLKVRYTSDEDDSDNDGTVQKSSSEDQFGQQHSGDGVVGEKPVEEAAVEGEEHSERPRQSKRARSHPIRPYDKYLVYPELK